MYIASFDDSELELLKEIYTQLSKIRASRQDIGLSSPAMSLLLAIIRNLAYTNKNGNNNNRGSNKE